MHAGPVLSLPLSPFEFLQRVIGRPWHRRKVGRSRTAGSEEETRMMTLSCAFTAGSDAGQLAVARGDAKIVFFSSHMQFRFCALASCPSARRPSRARARAPLLHQMHIRVWALRGHNLPNPCPTPIRTAPAKPPLGRFLFPVVRQKVTGRNSFRY